VQRHVIQFNGRGRPAASSADLLLEVTETKPEHQTDVMVEANQLVHQPICYSNMGKNLRHQTLSKPNELGRIQRLGEES